MLAYLFWHRPRDGADVGGYEQATVAFHRSLARTPPAGMLSSASFRAPVLPWQPEGGYEDWYLLEDFAALGVLNRAAIGHGHRTPHDRAARLSGWGTGGVYALLEGRPADGLRGLGVAAWIAPAKDGTTETTVALLAEMLADGAPPGEAAVWQRQLVLGPAPEFCVLARELPDGVREERLPRGWRAAIAAREPIWSG